MNSKRLNNFDLLRLILAMMVVLSHAAILTQIEVIKSVSLFFSSDIAVDSFFVVSGFLIFMSFDRGNSIGHFFDKRVRRIAPAYSAVILLCAIFLFFISTESFMDYFTIEFFRYIFFNLLTLNFIQPTLPGLFETNNLQAINGALWTIKIEVAFYILVPIIGYILSKKNKLFTMATIYILSIIYSLVMMRFYISSNSMIYIILEKQIPGQLAFFISGAFIYYFYDTFVKRSLAIFLFSFVLLLIHFHVMNIYFIYPAALAVVIIYFATMMKYLGDFGRFGDLSFGLYIWHFPIIQTFVFYDLFDDLVLGLIALSISLFVVSFLSWHMIEKRFLYPSSHYRAVEK